LRKAWENVGITKVNHARATRSPGERCEARTVERQTYQFVVAGELGDRVEPALGGLTIARCDETTTLTGEVRDQAELHGFLDRISALGLTLLEARAVDDSGLDRSGANSQARR
jgi:hypothetical protein